MHGCLIQPPKEYGIPHAVQFRAVFPVLVPSCATPPIGYSFTGAVLLYHSALLFAISARAKETLPARHR